MEVVYDGQFRKIYFEKDKNIFHHDWFEGNENMTDEDIQEVILAQATLTQKYKPDFILADNRNRVVVFSLDLQVWMSKIVKESCVEGNVQKYAILLPKEYIAQVSTTMAVDEDNPKGFNTIFEYFNTKEEAMTWFGF